MHQWLLRTQTRYVHHRFSTRSVKLLTQRQTQRFFSTSNAPRQPEGSVTSTSESPSNRLAGAHEGTDVISSTGGTGRNAPKGKIVQPPGSPRVVQRSEMYGIPIYQWEGPRDHLWDDGIQSKTNIRYPMGLRDQQPQKYTIENGQTFLIGAGLRPLDEQFWHAETNQKWYLGMVNRPLHFRARSFTYGNYDFIMKMDYVKFWLPAFLVLLLAVPAFCTIYMHDELTYTTMTVKVIGRQWYWVYEVETPMDEEPDEADA